MLFHFLWLRTECESRGCACVTFFFPLAFVWRASGGGTLSCCELAVFSTALLVKSTTVWTFRPLWQCRGQVPDEHRKQTGQGAAENAYDLGATEVLDLPFLPEQELHFVTHLGTAVIQLDIMYTYTGPEGRVEEPTQGRVQERQDQYGARLIMASTEAKAIHVVPVPSKGTASLKQ